MLDNLFIKILIKLDKKQNPFWCALLIKEWMDGTTKKEDIMLEIIGNEVFDVTDQKKMMDQYERVFVRMAKELVKYSDKDGTVFKMFIQQK